MIQECQCFSTHIFLAEDDEDDRDFFTQAVAEVCAEATITLAKNGLELMDMLHIPPVPPPDVIFLDLNMPGKNGYDCIKEIRQDNAMKDFPVVIFTTSSLKRDIEAMQALGANLFISKPANYTSLKLLIKKVLNINWAEHRMQQAKHSFVLTA